MIRISLVCTGALLSALSLPVQAKIIEAQNQPQNQPEEVIRETPLQVFSDRSALWPSLEAPVTSAEIRPLSEALNLIPGLQVRDNGSPALAIRGSAAADRVLRLYEGIPLNLGDGLGASRLFIPEEALAGSTVFKGPASVFFGASAMAGAVDHRMRIFEKALVRASVSDQGGHQGNRQIFAALPVFAGLGQITVNHSADPGQYPFTSAGQSYLRSSNANETTRLTAIGRRKAGQTTLRPTLLIAKSVGESPGSIKTPWPSTHAYTGLLAGLDSNTAFAGDRELTLKIISIRQWGLFDRGRTDESNSFTGRSQASADLRLPLTGSVTSRSFVDFRTDQLRATYLDGNTLHQDELEIGQALDIALTTSLSVAPAVRFLPESGVFTKALALSRTRRQERQWLLYAEGYRRPSLSDRFASTSYFVGNRGLQPERSESLELGGELGQTSFRVTAAAFRVQYFDLFQSSAITPTTATKINAGRAQTDGAELAVYTRLDDFDLTLATSVLEARSLDRAEPLTLSPRSQTNLSLSHTGRRWIYETALTHWTSFFDRDPATGHLVELDAWTTLDVGMRTVGLAQWEIKFGVHNLLDAPRELTLGYPEPQRRLYASAARSF